jgi:hypothetical protein
MIVSGVCMSSSGIQRTAFALLVALMLYVAMVGG